MGVGKLINFALSGFLGRKCRKCYPFSPPEMEEFVSLKKREPFFFKRKGNSIVLQPPSLRVFLLVFGGRKGW